MWRRLNLCTPAALILAAVWVLAARDAWPQSAPASSESDVEKVNPVDWAIEPVSALSAASSQTKGGTGATRVSGRARARSTAAFGAHASSWTAGADSFGSRAQQGGIWRSAGGYMPETGSSAEVAGGSLSNPLAGNSQRRSRAPFSAGALIFGTAGVWTGHDRSFGARAQPGGIWRSEQGPMSGTGSSAGLMGTAFSNPLGGNGHRGFGLLPPAGASLPSMAGGWGQPATGRGAASGVSLPGLSMPALGSLINSLSARTQYQGSRPRGRGEQPPRLGLAGSLAGRSARGFGRGVGGRRASNSQLGSARSRHSGTGLSGGLNNTLGNGGVR